MAEVVDGAFEMGDVDAFVDDHAFELVEHVGVREILLAAVAFGDVDHTDWGILILRRFAFLRMTILVGVSYVFEKALHFADLAVGCVGGENHWAHFGMGWGVDPEGFLSVAGGVVFGEVEAFEDIEVPVYFGVS